MYQHEAATTVRELPEALPDGERILWQDAPDWRALYRRAFHGRTLAVYFALVIASRGLYVSSQGAVLADALMAMLWLLPFGSALARRFGAEIISVDSAQVYRGMDIGTAKATPAERAAVLNKIADRMEANLELLADTDLGFTFRKQRADNQLLVGDGETAVIGGLTVTQVTSSKSGIPLLVDLPLIGRLFGVTRTSEQKRDLLILVTPHIIDEGERTLTARATQALPPANR